MNKQQPIVGIVMGSDSDLPIMQSAADILNQFNIPFELTIVSAHRTPLRLVEYASKAKERGLKVIIAGAGGAAHLPGMIASITNIPVVGVPIKNKKSLSGIDSVLSILQMPDGVPVATVALDGAKNAGLLAAQIIATFDDSIFTSLELYKKQLETDVAKKVSKLKEDWNNDFDL
ncbi:MAG: 5-(carboxyamino)imidazole ribonucleotide mutase [Chitinophagaceae bacterium]